MLENRRRRYGTLSRSSQKLESAAERSLRSMTGRRRRRGGRTRAPEQLERELAQDPDSDTRYAPLILAGERLRIPRQGQVGDGNYRYQALELGDLTSSGQKLKPLTQALLSADACTTGQHVTAAEPKDARHSDRIAGICDKPRWRACNCRSGWRDRKRSKTPIIAMC